jgi:hypothetical protein
LQDSFVRKKIKKKNQKKKIKKKIKKTLQTNLEKKTQYFLHLERSEILGQKI